MPKAKGPKVELPDALASELASAQEESPAEEPEGEEAAAADSSSESELEELRDRYLRLAAEFENFRRRTLRERQELQNYATENLIKDLLLTVDNLERALGHARQQEEGGEIKNLLEGVELTYRSLMQLLEKAGVRVVGAEGETFDPSVHEAIRQVPSEEHPPGTVIEVFQKGYLMKDRLLRPALVAVSAPSENGSD